jgi:hypothetical protein
VGGEGQVKAKQNDSKKLGPLPIHSLYAVHMHLMAACNVAEPFAVKILLTSMRISIWPMEDIAFA